MTFGTASFWFSFTSLVCAFHANTGQVKYVIVNRKLVYSKILARQLRKWIPWGRVP